MNKTGIRVVGCLLIPLSTGCSLTIPRNPVPDELVDIARPHNLENVRYWGDSEISELDGMLVESRWDAMAEQQQHYLALSGGSENGAYGAGFLNGWTATGTRPEFTIVTGISTGALIAPFAFLGPEYDDEIKYFYSEYSTDDLIEKRGPWALLRNAAAYDTSLLREKIAEFFDQEVMEKVAAEYQRGRLLNIGTVNLDAGRPVVWSIGRIASSGDPGALDLIHDIILASASVGGVFPPVLFEVEANGEIYDEMHVDGGTVNQVFVYPLELDWAQLMERVGVEDPPKVYVLRNARLRPRYSATSYQLTEIIGRSVGSLIRTQGLGDLDRIFLETQRDGLEFYLTYIPEDFTAISNEPFDLAYMRQLYEVGYNQASSDQPWERFPPGYETR